MVDYEKKHPESTWSNSGGNETAARPRVWNSMPNPQNILTCFIINMRNHEKIFFPCYPQDLSENYSTEFDNSSARGRTAPYFSYNQNGSRALSYSVELHDDLCNNMLEIVESLKRLVYPEYSGSIVMPPYCYLHFGDMLDCYAVMEGIDFSWGDSPVLENKQHFSKVSVSFSFQELRLSSLPTLNGPFNEGKSR